MQGEIFHLFFFVGLRVRIYFLSYPELNVIVSLQLNISKGSSECKSSLRLAMVSQCVVVVKQTDFLFNVQKLMVS